MAMILPERTVDIWTATFFTSQWFRARLWAPTERKPGERYDLGVGLADVRAVPMPPQREPSPNKVFVFEHKGVDQGSAGAAVVKIRVRQLFDHLAEDRARGGALVYYLLPTPDWTGAVSAPVGRIPHLAARRNRGPRSPGKGYKWEAFQRWAHVVDVEDLRDGLEALLMADPARFRGRSIVRGHDWACALTLPEVRELPNRVTLLTFSAGLRRCTHGRRAAELAGSSPPSPASPAERLGPTRASLIDAFRASARGEPDGEQTQPGDWGEAPEEADDELAEVFERPAYTTVYGVGDSDQIEEEEPPSLLDQRTG